VEYPGLAVVVVTKSSGSTLGIKTGFTEFSVSPESSVAPNKGLCKGYQPQLSALAYNLYLDLDYSGYHKSLIQ